ncbi:deaminase domain-containing protein [Listeria booriae]|uniref:deaminase domain-containing protein n=1 Tax=Listeria booriae TaxID=1552123 RepID=UPI0021AB1E90|nr:deaminase domain-containing protein [Listeria booriae]
MDVKYKENEWNKSKDALKGLINSGWLSGKGVTDYLKDINRNFEDAQNDIRKDDPDGAVSFSFTDKESSYQKMFEKIETLQDYAGEAGSLVERVIDEPFYKDIDKFVEKMEALSIEDYETKNTIGATTTITTNYGHGYGGAPQTTTVPKDKINLSDIMAGDNFFADNLKAQFAEYSKQNPDQEFTYEQYQSAVSSSRAFEYESIRDGQQNIEFWRDIGIAVVIIATSIVCPPAGLALGIAYGTLELSSAATGKDWLTGREMDAGERATRGAFALLDIIPGVKGLHAFSTATKAGGVALDAVQAGSKLTLKQTAKQGLSNLDAMGKQALRESAERIRKIPSVVSDVASSTKAQLKNATVNAGKIADTVKTGLMNLNPRRIAIWQDSADGLHIVHDAAENAKTFENMAIKFVSGGNGSIDKFPTRIIDMATESHIVDSVRDFRGSLPSKYKKSGNVAFAEVRIEGIAEDSFFAHSSIDVPNATVQERVPNISKQPEKPIFEATEAVGKDGLAYMRDSDTEYKILNDIASKLGDNVDVAGKIKLFTELDTCSSCNRIIAEFSAKFKNITVEVIHSNGERLIP